MKLTSKIEKKGKYPETFATMIILGRLMTY